MQRIFLLVLLAIGIPVSAQNLSSKNRKAIELYTEADNYRVRSQFTQAINLLNEAVNRDKNFEEAYYRLGTIYKVMEQYELATGALEKGIALVKSDSRKRMYLYDLAAVNIRQGKYELCKKYSTDFLQIEKEDRKKADLAKVWIMQAEYALTNTTAYDYVIRPLSDSVNIFPMQYFPTVTADGEQLIFTARFGGTRNDNEDLVVSTRSANGSWQSPVSLSSNINTVMREGASTISADGRHLIFTVCGASGCDLYESRKTGNAWSKPKSLGAAINSPSWDAQPSLSADGRELYFVSDRTGGLGGYDIWYSRLENNVWGKAANVGPAVNTPFDEISPYIHVNNRDLYVVSNGYPGYGGYDIYRIERNSSGWSTPVNLGMPLNDHRDQYSFIVSADGAIAYYSREESKNRSRLFKIVIPPALMTNSVGNILKGTITNSRSNQPMAASVELFDLMQNQLVSQVYSDSVTGQYLMVLPGGSEYALHVSSPGFLFHSLHFDYQTTHDPKPLVKDIALLPVQQNALVVLNNLFFDLNKYELRPESITELMEVVKFMQLNGAVKVEIGGHTDNTGNESYNQQLSEKRAGAVAEFLISNQIAPSRIQIRGYGSKKPQKPNDSDENRQQNRRIEFKILS